MYRSAFIEEEIIGKTLSNTNSKDSSHSQSWNEEDHEFNYQLDKWGFVKLFHTSDELLFIELKIYVEDR